MRRSLPRLRAAGSGLGVTIGHLGPGGDCEDQAFGGGLFGVSIVCCRCCVATAAWRWLALLSRASLLLERPETSRLR